MTTPAGAGTSGADNLQRLTDGGAGGDHIINDQHAALQWGTDQIAAFAVRLGLFAVEAVRHIATMVIGQRDRRGGG